MPELNMRYFEELGNRINQRLEELRTPFRDLQMRKFPWLYGALGEVPSDVMFICENPSLVGVQHAHIDTIDGRLPDIEAQWWGGRNNAAAKRFRSVLCQMGLKTNRPDARGGWRCYITNVVKEANVAGMDQRTKSLEGRREQARMWADILRWELQNVRPKHVFCVGGASCEAVTWLQGKELLPQFQVVRMWHYSARGREEDVIRNMLTPLKTALGPGFGTTRSD